MPCPESLRSFRDENLLEECPRASQSFRFAAASSADAQMFVGGGFGSAMADIVAVIHVVKFNCQDILFYGSMQINMIPPFESPISTVCRKAFSFLANKGRLILIVSLLLASLRRVRSLSLKANGNFIYNSKKHHFSESPDFGVSQARSQGVLKGPFAAGLWKVERDNAECFVFGCYSQMVTYNLRKPLSKKNVLQWSLF